MTGTGPETAGGWKGLLPLAWGSHRGSRGQPPSGRFRRQSRSQIRAGERCRRVEQPAKRSPNASPTPTPDAHSRHGPHWPARTAPQFGPPPPLPHRSSPLGGPLHQPVEPVTGSQVDRPIQNSLAGGPAPCWFRSRNLCSATPKSETDSPTSKRLRNIRAHPCGRYIVAGATGDGIGSENVTDGLGLALTGAVWVLLGYALTHGQQNAPAAQ